MVSMSDYQKFIAISRYAKWLPEENRRESWEETVDRYMEEVVEPKLEGRVSFGEVESLGAELSHAIEALDVMPSMRAVMTAGKALERDNTCGYNCSYLPVDSLKSFDEAMFILLCGTGVGFSVERQYIKELPEVPLELTGFDEVCHQGYGQQRRVVLEGTVSYCLCYSLVKSPGTILLLLDLRVLDLRPLVVVLLGHPLL
jgi:ribonucleoside-triphosphate reductase